MSIEHTHVAAVTKKVRRKGQFVVATTKTVILTRPPTGLTKRRVALFRECAVHNTSRKPPLESVVADLLVRRRAASLQ